LRLEKTGIFLQKGLDSQASDLPVEVRRANHLTSEPLILQPGRFQNRLRQSGVSRQAAALSGWLDRLAAFVSQDDGRRSLRRLRQVRRSRATRETSKQKHT
jgi:hypothetical protein